MKEYNCPRCGYTVSHKSHIRNHINRKKLCSPVLSDIIPKECADDILKGSIVEEDDKVKRLERRIKELEKENKKSVTINNTTNNLTVNITLPYRETNHNFLTDKDYLRCLNRMIMSVPRLIERIHFDPKHPENHNIYINDMSRNRIMVYDGSQWNMQNQKDTVERLINDHDFLLDEWVECGGEKYPDAMEKFEKYVELRSKNDIEEKIKDEVKFILYNNRDLCKTKSNQTVKNHNKDVITN